jgi:hypothetical protein
MPARTGRNWGLSCCWPAAISTDNGFCPCSTAKCTIPEKSDQVSNRQKLGSRGGPPAQLRQGRLQAAACGRVRDQPPQETPHGRHRIRQAGRPLPRNHRRKRASSQVDQSFRQLDKRSPIDVLCTAQEAGRALLQLGPGRNLVAVHAAAGPPSGARPPQHSSGVPVAVQRQIRRAERRSCCPPARACGDHAPAPTTTRAAGPPVSLHRLAPPR